MLLSSLVVPEERSALKSIKTNPVKKQVNGQVTPYNCNLKLCILSQYQGNIAATSVLAVLSFFDAGVSSELQSCINSI